jgi:transcriptional regulator with XRE-family HTH domain
MRALADYLVRTQTTQAAFARKVRVSQPTIWNLINGKHSASVALLRRISRETGLSTDELLADETAALSPDDAA